jgi:hypothetical protein
MPRELHMNDTAKSLASRLSTRSQVKVLAGLEIIRASTWPVIEVTIFLIIAQFVPSWVGIGLYLLVVLILARWLYALKTYLSGLAPVLAAAAD